MGGIGGASWLQVSSSSLLILILLSNIGLHLTNANFGLTLPKPLPPILMEVLQPLSQARGTQSIEPPSVAPGGPFSILERRWSHRRGPRDTCHQLRLTPKQRRMCRRDRGSASALLEAFRLSARVCQAMFVYERWDCPLEERYRTNLLRTGQGLREVSFLHALTAASLTYTISRACSTHTLDRCTCDNREAWKWGGCGDNIPYAARFTRRFLLPHRRMHEDIQADIRQHNILTGIRVIRQSKRRQCKCHGTSGSCTFKTCWYRVSPFWKSAKLLKTMYQNAKQKRIGENSSGRGTRVLKYDGLAYTERSPSFCTPTMFSPGVSDRLCNSTSTCDNMCCGRGYNVHIYTNQESCNCLFTWCCEVKCQTCNVRKEKYTCK